MLKLYFELVIALKFDNMILKFIYTFTFISTWSHTQGQNIINIAPKKKVKQHAENFFQCSTKLICHFPILYNFVHKEQLYVKNVVTRQFSITCSNFIDFYLTWLIRQNVKHTSHRHFLMTLNKACDFFLQWDNNLCGLFEWFYEIFSWIFSLIYLRTNIFSTIHVSVGKATKHDWM